MERYSRQLMLDEIGEAGQRKLSDAKVLIVGVGGLGSPIATYLAGAGVGTIGLVDADVLSISNLQRQVLYAENQVGKPKVLCAKERLLSLNSTISIKTYHCWLTEENAKDIISEYDIVVDGTDNFDVRFVISDECERQHKPFVYGAICGFEGQVSVLCNGKATYRTLFPNEAETKAMPHPGKQVIGTTPAVVGSIEANQVLQLICNYGKPLIDRLWTIDLRTMDSFIIDLIF
ncbi:MAG: HesA/MoeB/ThiF family protein [Prevotella sp.]|nr:HesA/MoeB/ThiF family protein [Candidatus Prevotella equi]